MCLLEDGPVGLDAGDGRVLGVNVFGVGARHLRPVNHQADGGGARARQGGGRYADDVPIGPPASGWGKERSSVIG